MRLGVGAVPRETPLFRFLIVATTAVLLPLFLFSAGFSASAAASNPTVNRYNIVLVTDASLSMKYTDPEGQRYEAIGKFIAQSTEQGNFVGSVVFNEGVPEEGIYPLSEADGIQIKKAIVEKIRNVPLGSWTNIGLGLRTAVDMLGPMDADGLAPNGLPSIILLLSDGKTDMPEGDPTKLSLRQRDDAIEAARANKIRIFSVCLNADGTADRDEISRCASATGGQFHEVTDAADLEPVFETFRQIIFNSVDAGRNPARFDTVGKVEGTFKVPPIGVEEINISMPGITNANSGALNYTITDAAGRTYSKQALAAQTYTGKRFITIKFLAPKAGEPADGWAGTWSYTITGNPGERITVDFAYNSNLSATLRVSPEKEDYAAGESVSVIAQLLEDGEPARDAASLGYAASGTLQRGRNPAGPIAFEPGEDGEFIYTFYIEKSGSFTFGAEIKGGDGLPVEAGFVTIHAGNKPPVPKGDIQKSIRLWPRAANDLSIDLRPGAADEQSAPLEYEVTSTSFAPDEYEIKGATLELYSKPNALKIGSYSRSNGSFEITAYDAEGASCTFNVRVHTVDVTRNSIVTLLLIGLAVAAAVVAGILILKNKKFSGTCVAQLVDYAQGSQPAKQISKPRGNIKLTAFQIFLPGLDPGKCWFQASGKKYAYFRSKKPVCMNGKMQKKIKLDGMFSDHAQIAPNDQSSAYVEVWFVSDYS